MLLSLVATIVFQQAPASFEELEIDKLAAYHGLKSFHETMDVSSTINGSTTKVKRDTIMDGDKLHVVLSDSGGPKIEQICDGTNCWFIFRPKRIYFEEKADPTPFDPKAHLLKTDPDTGSMNLNFGIPLQFAHDPAPTIASCELVQAGREKLMKVVALATGTEGRKMTITQWFLPDRWILKRATMIGEGKDGPISIAAEVSRLDFKAVIGPRDFLLDRTVEQSFQKADGPPPDIGS